MHHYKPLAAAAFAACLGVAGPAVAQSTAQQSGSARSSATARLSSEDRDFLQQAAQSGMAEVQASRTALSKAQSRDVREFAQRMVDDHTQADQRLRQLAARKGVDLPSDPSMVEQAHLKLVASADGADFDQRYIDQFGPKAHHSTVSLFQQEIERGKDPDVVAFARQVLPTLKQHLQRAENLQASVGDNGSGARANAMGASAQRADNGDARQVRNEIDEAVQVVQRMKADPDVTGLLQRAKGVFILPDYGRGALGIGVQGGQGVLVTRRQDGFSNPVFFNMGGVSIGAQAGGSGGQLAMLLMTDKAVRDFRSGKNFSLDAGAGLTIGNYSQRGLASGGKVQDVIVWSGTRGAYAGASVGVTDVTFDDQANRAYYGRDNLDAARILSGGVEAPGNNVLGKVLAI